jgi:hypothetical protein
MRKLIASAFVSRVRAAQTGRRKKLGARQAAGARRTVEPG